MELRGGSGRRLSRFGRSLRLPGAVLWTLALLLLSGTAATAQGSREYQLKAVFLYNFAQFAEWPATAFAEDKSPIIIGIVGTNPFGTALEDTVHGETIDGRPLLVEHFARPADIKACHMLFISQSELRYADEILRRVKGKPVLTVADADSPQLSSVMIRFILENNKVHFRINAEAARQANLSLSSKLLRLAEGPTGGKVSP
jgi:hypothetical protein